VIKKQAISAYDPRVVGVTGITMMLSAQGADHTAGNVLRSDSSDKSIEEMVEASIEAQIASAAADSLGLCIFGRSVTASELETVVSAINDAHNTSLTTEFFDELGRDTLKLEKEFNAAAGFNSDDDELPAFFYNEALQPTGKQARFHSDELNQVMTKRAETV